MFGIILCIIQLLQIGIMRNLFLFLVISLIFSSCSVSKVTLGNKPKPEDTFYVELKTGPHYVGKNVTIERKNMAVKKISIDTMTIPVGEVYKFADSTGLYIIPRDGGLTKETGVFAHKIYEGKLNVWEYYYMSTYVSMYDRHNNINNTSGTLMKNTYLEEQSTGKIYHISWKDYSLLSVYPKNSKSYEYLYNYQRAQQVAMPITLLSSVFLIAGSIFLSSTSKVNGRTTSIFNLTGAGCLAIGGRGIAYAVKLYKKGQNGFIKSVGSYNGSWQEEEKKKKGKKKE